MGKNRGNRVLTGTWGELWVDGELIAELKKVELKITVNREDVQMGIDVDSKITGLKGELTISFNKTFSMFNDKFEDYKNGIDTRFQIITKLQDPDAVGGQIERYSVENCWLNELALVGYEMGAIMEQEFSGGFTPTDMINLDKIER